jgi:putative MATE family efflux protein
MKTNTTGTEPVNPSAQPENKMGLVSIGRLLLTMSVPMMLSMMVQALYNIVDAYFVAQISENAMTAVTLAFPLQNLMISVGVGIGVGVNAVLSKNLGERNFADVNRAAGNGILLIWASSFIFLLLGLFAIKPFFQMQVVDEEIITLGHAYATIVCCFSIVLFTQVIMERLLISTGKTLYSMMSQILGAVVNIILDPIMIFGLFGFPAMGVAGAAWATVIGQLLASLFALTLNLCVNKEIQLGKEAFRPCRRILRDILVVGMPSCLMMSVGSIMMLLFNRILLSFTSTSVAVFGVYFRLQSIIFMPVFGLSNAVVSILAYNYGAKNQERIHTTIRLSFISATAIMVVGFLVFQASPDGLLRLFNATDNMLAIGVPALRIVSTSFLVAGVCVVSGSVFQAFGRGMETFVLSVARQLIVLLPVAWLMSLSGNINLVWLSFPISEVATLLMSIFFLRKLYREVIRPLTL